MTAAHQFPEGAVAIVGLAGRFPGANDLGDFWRVVSEGVEVLEEFSDADLDAAGVPREERAAAAYVRRGTALQGAEMFDAAFFGYSPREAQVLDPQQRIFLECAWEALEDAGFAAGRIDAAVGVYGGAGINSYLLTRLVNQPTLLASIGSYQLMLASDKDFLCTRASYKLDLRGPSMTIQTACSTSLVAVEVACRALQRGECDLALAGGVSVPFPQRAGYLYQEGMILSPDGRCRPFDARARGTRPGAGCGIVVLKRLADALADRDMIRAVIRGAAVNNDGAAKAGYTAPSVEGQAEVIATAQMLAEVDARSIGYIEAHGTGTPLGDPIEIAALTQVFRAGTSDVGFCRLGSIKANFGHLDAAAGVAGLIKAVRVLERRKLPPLVNFESPNPQLQLESSPFTASAQGSDWAAGSSPRRAGVSSFGIGGTNAHVVLEEFVAPPRRERRCTPQLLVLSARSATALETSAQRLAEHLETRPEIGLADAAWTLQSGRRAFDHRRAIVVASAAQAAKALRGEDGRAGRSATAVHEGGDRPVAFLFSGQGSQFPGMGEALFRTHSVYREAIDACADGLHAALGCDLRDLLFGPEGQEVIHETRYAQPALFASEYALARLWMHWGVQPAAMLGHSIGEYVAAHLAGVMSLEDALTVVAERGRLMQAMPSGGMAAIHLSADEVRLALGPAVPQVEIAAINAPSLCTIAGPPAALDVALTLLRSRGVDVRALKTSHAFHSAMMQPVLEPFRALLARVRLSPPQLPFVSNVTGTWIRAEEATSPDYYARHLRSAVLFAAGVRTLASRPGLQLLEVGPGRALTTLANLELGRGARPACASLPGHLDHGDECSSLLEAAGRLWLAGVPLRWDAMQDGRLAHRVPMPTYPFERKRYCVESAVAAPIGTGSSEPPRAKDPADFLYSPTWMRADHPGPRSVDARRAGRWFVVGGGPGRRRQVIDAFHAAGVDATALDDRGALALAASEARSAGMQVAGAVLLSPALDTDTDSLDAGAMFTAPTAIVEDLAISETRPARVVIVSAAAHAVLEEQVLVPDAAFSWGPVLSLPQEVPGADLRMVDVAANIATAESKMVAANIVSEALAVDLEPLVAYRAGRRWVRRFEPQRLGPPVAGRWPLREGAVVVITGGLGGMGLEIALRLAQRGRVRLLLTGRSAPPPRDAWDAWLAARPAGERNAAAIRGIRAIEAAGGEVLVAAADASDEDAMRRAIAAARERWGRIDGLLHGAGLPGAGRVSVAMTARDLALVCAPKVDGLRVLVRLLAEDQLSLVVLMSSVNAAIGAAGASDYSAANAWLGAFAESTGWPNGWPPALCLDWGAWRDVGMAARLVVPPSLRPAWSSHLAQAITTAEGLEIFERAVSHGARRLLVLPFDPRRPASSRRVLGAGAPIVAAEAEGSDAGIQSAPTDGAQPVVHAEFAAPAGRVEREVAAIWSELLGVERVGALDDFFALGGHSLLATRVLSRIETTLGARLSLGDIFEAPTLRALATRVASVAGAAPAARSTQEGSVTEREELEF